MEEEEVSFAEGGERWTLTLVFGKQSLPVAFEPQHPQRVARLQMSVTALTGVAPEHQRLLYRGSELRADCEGLANGTRLLLLRSAAFHAQQAATAAPTNEAPRSPSPLPLPSPSPSPSSSPSPFLSLPPKAPAVDLDALGDDEVLVQAMRGRAEYVLVLPRDTALLEVKRRLCAVLGVGAGPQGIRLVLRGKSPPDHTPLGELLLPARSGKPPARSLKCMVLLHAQQHVLAEKEDELRQLLNELAQLQVDARRTKRQIARNFAGREESTLRVVALADAAQRVQSNLELLLDHLAPRGGAAKALANAQTREALATAIEDAQTLIADLELRVHFPAATAAGSSAGVRVTPRCAGVDFSPSSFVFKETRAVYHFAITPFATGNLTIEYVAIDEAASGMKAISLFNQTIEVLQPPKAFELSDAEWHGVILQNDSFDQLSASNNSAYSSPLWSRLLHGYPSNACSSFDGNRALYFTSLGDRYAVTSPLNLLGFHGKMHFYHVYGFMRAQSYDSTGGNLVSCERVDAGEETVFSFLPPGQDALNRSAWQRIYQVPLDESAGIITARNFSTHSVLLPAKSMHAAAQFRWEQKNHSSFPLEVATGMTTAAMLAAMNDETGVNGQLGADEREVWRYRNLFDQWALDNVRIEARLNVPVFIPWQELIPGSTEVLVMSPIAGSWVETLVGNGTHKFPSCSTAGAGSRAAQSVLQLSASGYIHAVACLFVNSLLVSSFPARSPRFVVQARAPEISSVLDSTAGIDTWKLKLKCTECTSMRYTQLSPLTVVDDDNASSESDSPSCSYGALVESAAYEMTVTTNARVQVVACARDLVASDIATSVPLRVRPRAPTFSFEHPETTVSGLIDVTIVPSVPASVGIVYVVGDNAVPPDCADRSGSGAVTIRVRVSDVVRAAACCIDRECDDSEVAVWGSLSVSAVAPAFTTACSRVKPLTMTVEMRPVTLNAAVRYQVGRSASPLTCSSGSVYSEPVEVSLTSTTVYAVSCLEGLTASKQTEIPVLLDSCCAGADAYTHPSCAHVLLLEDDFSASCADTSRWDKVTSQWGGQDVNGGVHASNVACTRDAERGKNVLVLSAHGDLYPGVAPAGRLLSSSDGGAMRERTVDDGFFEWALDGAGVMPCNELERCPARRVGAAVSTKLTLNAGILLVRFRPCDAFGTLTQIWWGQYEENEAVAQQEVPFLPLWKAALYQAKTTTHVPFALSSPLSPHPTGFVEIGMQWDASSRRANLYADGALVLQQNASSFRAAASSGANSSLSIGVWFPNAVAGEPRFQSCVVLVDRVQVFSPEIAGGRWCDVGHDVVRCASDLDCQQWVAHNCFMRIYDATCAAHSDELRDLATPTAGEGGGAASTTDANAPLPDRFCHFRLQPSAHSTVTSTEMTSRDQRVLS
ncbi:hypothetical protein PybrP1_008133 [[Pythium] brassicae (nom. inval.)]|nr:hypothetical protein PybrP1_008133 [[Pythium] brassicae (nom. inval.)]